MSDYFSQEDLKQLAYEMDTHTFEAGDVLVKKEEQLDSLVIIAKGSHNHVSPGCFTIFHNVPYIADDGTPLLPFQGMVYYTSIHVHEKNLYHLGEDRMLIALLLKYYPDRSLTFIPEATCWTIVPHTFRPFYPNAVVGLTQRCTICLNCSRFIPCEEYAVYP